MGGFDYFFFPPYSYWQAGPASAAGHFRSCRLGGVSVPSMGVSWGQPSGVCMAPTLSLVWPKTTRPYPVDARRCPISAIAQEGCLLRCCWCKVRHSFTERLGLSSPLCSSLLGETGDRTDLSPPGEGPSCSPGLWSPVWLYQKAAGRGGRDRAGIDKPVNFPWQ